ncbi:YveK family protein [Niallia sp. 01092]|uniref:YveK family protein n=1 Tax=unclassified Niallia TaxID=2837522 RepID=UPI003FD0F403
MDETITIKEFFYTLKKRALLIISLMLIMATITGFVSKYFVTPTYKASTQLLINTSNEKKPANKKKSAKEKVNEEDNQYTSDQLITNLQLIKTYKVIIESPKILDKVISELNLKKSADELKGMLEIENEEGSQVMVITVTDTNAENAAIIANQVAKVFKKENKDIMDIDNVEIIAEAKYFSNQIPIGSQPIQNIMIALIVGLIIGIGLSLILDYFDSTVKTKKDLETALQIPILGVVPPIKSRKRIIKENKMKTEYRGETLGS